MRGCKNHMEEESKVFVSVDVTKIVKYCCVASVLIVGTIFGSSVLKKYVEKKDC
ncbi:hypothetical protein [Velocimicrobium porci]|uniref:hypothetical protein n=1 Tax=Velocimicrobium porci TaxID=2606634 RepID=UPI0012B1B8FB|nr:hypothetical protein [Velocimicrobium porci]